MILNQTIVFFQGNYTELCSQLNMAHELLAKNPGQLDNVSEFLTSLTSTLSRSAILYCCRFWNLWTWPSTVLAILLC